MGQGKDETQADGGEEPESRPSELQGLGRLAIEATMGVIDVVEAMHRTIASGPEILGQPLEGPARLLTKLAYGSVRGVTQLVGTSIDVVLAQFAPLLAAYAPEPGPTRDVLLAVLNGVVGDYLSETKNPLAIEMRLRHEGRPLELEREALRATFPQASHKLLVMVHGSCRNDRQWKRLGRDCGAELASELGFTPVYLHYNTGLHISTNGRTFAALLERLVAQWPVPVDEVSILAHSMGGLVARSACHYGEVEGHVWRQKLRKLICIATPHHGAPMERGGSWVDLLLGISTYSAPLAKLGQIRSAGVTDMRYGNVLDEHWKGRDRFAHGADARCPLKLPEGVECSAIAATTSPKGCAQLAGDGLVPVDSALGRHKRAELTLAFPEAHQWIGFEMGHLDLLERPEVYATLRQWLSPSSPVAESPGGKHDTDS